MEIIRYRYRDLGRMSFFNTFIWPSQEILTESGSGEHVEGHNFGDKDVCNDIFSLLLSVSYANIGIWERDWFVRVLKGCLLEVKLCKFHQPFLFESGMMLYGYTTLDKFQCLPLCRQRRGVLVSEKVLNGELEIFLAEIIFQKVIDKLSRTGGSAWSVYLEVEEEGCRIRYRLSGIEWWTQK